MPNEQFDGPLESRFPIRAHLAMNDPPPTSTTAPIADIPKRRHSRLALLATTSLFVFACAEVAVRLTGETDRDGAFTWRNTTVWPLPLPVSRHDELMAPLRAELQPRLVYHETLGWALNPHPGVFQDLYYTNDDGIRTGADRKRYAPQAAEGVTRVVLAGDSFTYCDELPFEQSWGHRLETALNERGLAVEVINLGVSGYGMDQALLRLRTHGLPLAPDFVIFGLRPENAARNLSVVRLFYKHGSKIPYTKPRFVLDGANELRLVNSPALDPERLNRMLHDGSIRDWADVWHQSSIDCSFARSRTPTPSPTIQTANRCVWRSRSCARPTATRKRPARG
jgi:hypothetical protein